MILTLADRMVAYGQQQSGGGGNQKETTELVTAVVVTLVVLSLILIVGQLIWNNVLTRIVSVLRPTESVWDILLLYIFLNLMFAK
tara:strand:- start:387 stop:641 length:255 start_codon:yes stop_codon:yes gene_type:complete